MNVGGKLADVPFVTARTREQARTNTEKRIRRLRAEAASLVAQADRLQRILDGKEKP